MIHSGRQQGILNTGEHVEDLGVEWKIILNWVLKEEAGRACIGSSGSGQGQVAVFCEYGDETPSSIKFWEFFGQLRNCQLFKTVYFQCRWLGAEFGIDLCAYLLQAHTVCVGPVAQSVQRLTKGWTVRDRIPVGTRFSTRPDRPWGPPSLLHNGYRVFPGGRGGRCVGLTTHPHLECRSPRKSRVIPLLTLRAFVAYTKG